MLVLDALFDHFRQISSNVEIIGSLVQRSPISAIDVRVESVATEEVEATSSSMPAPARTGADRDRAVCN